MDRSLRIALVELFGIGGTADYTDCLARALRDRGHRVSVVTSTLFAPLDGKPDPEAFPVFDYQPSQPKPLKALLLGRALLRARRVLLELRPQVVHAQGTVIPSAERLLYRRPGAAVRVCTVHDVNGHEHRAVLGSFARFYAGFDGLICHSQSSMHRLKMVVPGISVTAIPHPRYTPLANRERQRAEARGALGISSGARMVLMFGFIRPYKGLDLFLRALRIAAGADPNVLGLVAGRPLYDITASRRSAEALGIPVRWDLRYVSRSEIATYFAAADVVSLAYLDTSDSGLLELAAAFGRPVVVSDAGGMAEAFARYGVGAVVPAGDAAALARSMLGSYDAHSRAPSAGVSWAEAADQTERVYLELLNAREAAA